MNRLGLPTTFLHYLFLLSQELAVFQINDSTVVAPQHRAEVISWLIRILYPVLFRKQKGKVV